jgi:plastocyanin
MRRALPGALALAAAPLLGGAAPAPAPAPRVYNVVIDQMKFGAVPSGARVGDTILWINRDMFRHTATARDRSFNIDLPPGKSGRTLLKRAGRIAFYCVYHPGMTGTLTVGR